MSAVGELAILKALDRIGDALERLATAREGGPKWSPVIKRCGQPGCPSTAEQGLSLCTDCWDLANDARGDE